MLEINDKFADDQAELLKLFLTGKELPEGTMSYFELAGFLFAVCCSPDFVPPSEWIPVIFAEGEAVYQDIDEAQDALGAIMSLYNHILSGVKRRDISLPPDLIVRDPAIENMQPDADLSQWSKGFMNGHSWLCEAWDETLPDELDEELGALEFVLFFFAERKLAEGFIREMWQGDQTLDEAAAIVLPVFDESMRSYANLGLSIQETLAEFNMGMGNAGVQVPNRNDPCPCGSGKKFKKCCLM